MKKIDFLFLGETKVREIESIILIGTELEKQGYRVEYISFAEVHSNPFKVKKIKSKGVKVAVIPFSVSCEVQANSIYRRLITRD